MTRLPSDLAQQLWSAAPDFDAAVAATPHIDRFCSSTDWILPAAACFHPDATPVVVSVGNARFTFVRGVGSGFGAYLMPAEAVWALACPIAGPDWNENASRFREWLLHRNPGCRVVLVAGVVASTDAHWQLVDALAPHFRLRRIDPVIRHAASLEGGEDGYLSRRTRKFRANLRRIQRRASEDGVAYEVVRPATSDALDAVYERALAIELESWKTRAGNGVALGPMKYFTHGVLANALDSGDAPFFVFALHEGKDIGYLHGAVRGTYFRGLQMSFHDDARVRSVGNLLQWRALRALIADGVLRYDLGSSLPYKERWAEERTVTQGMLVVLP